MGSRADLERLVHRVTRLDVSPVHGGLLVDVELAELQLGLRVAFATSCQASRSESVSAAAAAFRLRGVVGIGLAEGRVIVDTADASAEVDGLRVDPTLLPARVVDTLDALLADRLTTLLADAVAAELPSLLLRGLGAPERGGSSSPCAPRASISTTAARPSPRPASRAPPPARARCTCRAPRRARWSTDAAAWPWASPTTP